MATSPRYAVGIDLGTTNSVVGYVPLDDDEAPVSLLPVPQLVAGGSVETRTNLPAFLYLPAEQEDRSAFQVPAITAGDHVAGEFARRQAALAPGRTVVGAKSWLTYSKVDRRQPILPWNVQDDVAKISPVEASQRYLEHLIAAWDQQFPDHPLAEQQVVLTVPASFDASARTLTREAAALAGLPDDLVLLEEPQAAVYSWLADAGDAWRKQLTLGDTLLICDVGGGTTDFTLIVVAEQDGELVLERRAVGNHVLVGGDNMDLALAHAAAGLFAEKNHKLDPWQSVSLWHACRAAKESLLGSQAPETAPVTVLGRGSRLIANTISVDLAAETVRQVLLEGFFPSCGLDAKPQRRRMSGFQEIGLPFESDPAISRHLAAFLSAHGGTAGPAQPTHVLFNGGVFKADLFRQRLLGLLGEWFSAAEPAGLLGQEDLDHAVARGAAYYAKAKTGRGVRIRGGTARSYYVGIETAGLAIPGAPRPLRALCVVPFGMEEGTEYDVPSDEIGLIVGEPAHFRFFSSAVRKDDQPGLLLDSWSANELEETDSLETTLPQAEGAEDDYVPVKFQSRITELGVLELWSVSTQADQRWKLEFSVREDAEMPGAQ